MPFEATETKNSRFGNRVRMSPEEALDVMHALRDELEVRPGRGGKGGATRVESDEGRGRYPYCRILHTFNTGNLSMPSTSSLASNSASVLPPALLCCLQLLRIVADQVRKRERLKKQLLKIWRAQKLGLVSCTLGWGKAHRS